MNKENYKVLAKVIGAVETGGQVYGNARYNAYVPPYTNTQKEHTITLGASQNYGASAERLVHMIYDRGDSTFARLDTATPSIGSMLGKDWVGMRWNPNASQKKALIAIIDSPVGHDCQDELFAEQMVKFVADCERDYTTNVPAVMMYCEIRHLGGKDPTDRIFGRCNGNYSLENILAALKKDQADTSSSNQVGDAKFWSRHEKCVEFIKKYAQPEQTKENTMSFKKYNLTDSQVKQIARLCVQEQGGSEAGTKAEASLMANLLETSSMRQNKYGSDGNGLYNFVRNGGWFYKAAHFMDDGFASATQVAWVKDVLVNGNRTLPQYIDEHDCFSDIASISTGNIRTRSDYVKNKTIIKNKMGSTYTFYCFPTSTSDPFGYTAAAYNKVAGEAKTPVATNAKTPDKVLAIAEKEEGYLEKKSNSQLDSKTANAGSSNYTKYARDVFPSLQGLPWCAMFVVWCLVQAFGKSAASAMVGGLSADCDEVVQNYKNIGRWFKTPKVGDQIVFVKDGDDYYHTGWVYKVTNSTVYTIEGNTSNGSEVIPNGGGVCKKSYALGNSKIGGYGRPKYDAEATPVSPATTEQKGNTLNENSKWTGYVTADSLNVRTWAGVENDKCSFSPLDRGTSVGVCDTINASDGSAWYYILYGGKHGFVSAQYISKTKPTTTTTKAAATTQKLKMGDTGVAVKTMQKMLIKCGYSCGSAGADGEFGEGTKAAVIKYQKAKGITPANGTYGPKTTAALTADYKKKTTTTKKTTTAAPAPSGKKTMLSQAKIVGQMAKDKGWKYGDSHSLPPCKDKWISCDRIVARTLYDLGYTDQPKGGITINNGIDTYLKKWGFTKVTSASKIKPGAVVAVGLNGNIEHVFIVEKYDHKTGICSKFDAGSDERIKKACHFKNVQLLEWSNRQFICAWNVPSKLA